MVRIPPFHYFRKDTREVEVRVRFTEVAKIFSIVFFYLVSCAFFSSFPVGLVVFWCFFLHCYCFLYSKRFDGWVDGGDGGGEGGRVSFLL